MANELDEILEKATIEQKRYIMARLKGKNRTQAAKEAGIGRGMIYKWENLADLERAADLLASDMVKVLPLILADSQTRLVELAPDAVDALGKSLKDRVYRVQAAKEILDRAGLPAKTTVDITTQGQPISIIEVVVPSDVPNGASNDEPSQ